MAGRSCLGLFTVRRRSTFKTARSDRPFLTALEGRHHADNFGSSSTRQRPRAVFAQPVKQSLNARAQPTPKAVGCSGLLAMDLYRLLQRFRCPLIQAFSH